MWAMQHARHVERQFESRVAGGVRPTLFIGPCLRPRTPLIEVMVELLPPDRIVVFHVMAVREKFLSQMHQQGGQ